jgi:hypothetical protein
MISCVWPAAAQQRVQSARRTPQTFEFTDAELKVFTLLRPIDAHTHILNNDPAFTSMLEHFNLHVLDIFVGHVVSRGESTYTPEAYVSRKEDSWNAVLSGSRRAKISTSFARAGWNDPHFSQASISSINEDFKRGAIAVTIWTNSITMLRNPSGKFVQSDDPKLEPIYRDMVTHHVPLISHTAMQDEDWVPEPGAIGGEEPAALAARDHILEQNPSLKVVAAHLGSYKENIDQLAGRLLRYFDLAVDTVGRMDYLMGIPKEQARAFILKFQDRILYGSDNSFYESDPIEPTLVRWQSRYALDVESTLVRE